MSQIGLFLWGAKAATGLFSVLILLLERGSTDWVRLCLAAGLLRGWMGLDDALLLHERNLPGRGISQKLILAIHGMLALACLVTSRAIIMESEIWLLALAMAGFATRVGLETLIATQPEAIAIAEGRAKFFGLSVWAAYHTITFALMLISARQHA